MTIASAVTGFLEKRSIRFEIVAPDNVSPEHRRRIIRAVLFRDEQMATLAVVPRDCFLDVEAIQKATGRALLPVFEDDVRNVVPTYNDAGVVPLGAMHGLDTVVQQDIPREGALYVSASNSRSLLRIDAAAFHALQQNAQDADIAFAVTPELIERRHEQHAFMRKRIETLLQDVEGLPAMPEMGQRILQVAGDADADAQDLAKVIEVDPSLAAQIISYATSAFYGYRGDITSVREAISRVLGFELVANIALGIAIGTSFRLPAEGPIGLSAFWRHAIYTAALAERLCKAVPRDRQMRAPVAYLSGLLHDFGFLVVGHLFPPAHQALNQAIAANPLLSITTLEELTVGITHTEIGPQLLRQWKLPEEVALTAEYHHTPEYRDECATYVQLVSVAERLLHDHGVVSDADAGAIPELIMALLGIDQEGIDKASKPVIDACAELDTLAQLLSQAA
jgi:HD-like signal output (HDOD) protein/prolyl-tRNA editing enzyme YbaK/EbsC (Cys-tRNA(Pro) deacylase)